MAYFKAAKITSQGQMMIMQDLNNQIDLQFTRIAYGNGIYTDEEYASLSSRTALKSQKQAFNINYKMIKGGTSLELGVVANNASLAEGYSMTEVGLFAKDASDENATEKLYAIAIAKNGCADYMPAYNGSSLVRVTQKFQVDVSDASSVTIEFIDGSVVSQSYLEEFYYNKTAVDTQLSKCSKIIELDDCTTAAQVMAYATSNELNNSVNYTYAFHISGDARTEFGITTANALALLTFDGAGVLLAFPFLHRFFHLSYNPERSLYYWTEKYADIDTSNNGEVATMINARHPKPKLAYIGTSIANATVSRNSTVADQLTNKTIGRLYISGTDFVEYVDLDSTANAEVISQTEPTDTCYIQTWHRTDGSIWQRTQIGDSGTPSAWAEISATTAT